jgi:hypothetical protein
MSVDGWTQVEITDTASCPWWFCTFTGPQGDKWTVSDEESFNKLLSVPSSSDDVEVFYALIEGGDPEKDLMILMTYNGR